MLQKKIKVSLMCILALLVSGFFGGCSQTSAEEDPSIAYLKYLEDGRFYIRHSDYSCDAPYQGETTFDGEASKADRNRIAWYKEDFENIPTLTSGDSLILYTESILSEMFVFEKFKDVGKSIALRGLEPTVSGRLSLSTDIEQQLTYPGGDTDEMCYLPNDVVIIDTLGGSPLRATLMEDGESFTTEGIVSEYGTILNLVEDQTYSAEVYNGTVRYDYEFTADTRILGSMDVITTTDYYFESEKLLVVNIPENMNSGYYYVGGQGMIRYIADEDAGKSIDEIDFNVPVEGSQNGLEPLAPTGIVEYDKTEELSELPEFNTGEYVEGGYENVTNPLVDAKEELIEYTLYSYSEEEENYISEVLTAKRVYNKIIVDINSVGYKQINIWLADGTGNYSEVKGSLTSPDSKYYLFAGTDESEYKNNLCLNMEATAIGKYVIELANLEDATPYLAISNLKVY